MPRSKFKKENARNLERQRSAWELFKHGANYAEIGRALGVHRATARRLVDRERRLVIEEISASVEEYRTEELSRLDNVLAEAMRVMTAKCRECKGTGQLRADGMSTDLMVICEKCDGLGRRYATSTQMMAADKVMKAISERAKLRGLYAPEKIAQTNVKGEDLQSEFEREIRGWDEATVDQELAELMMDEEDFFVVDDDAADG